MKKHFFISLVAIVLICTIIGISCSKNDENNQHNNGYGELIILINHSENQLEINKLKSVSIEDYSVTIYQSDGIIFKAYEHYSNLPESIVMAEGEYYVVAHSGNDSTAAFSNPYFYGKSENFSIGNGKITSVDITCTVQNCAVSVMYDENLIQNFSEYYTVVKSESDSLIFSNTETRNGYFRIHDLEIYTILSFELENGSMDKKIVKGNILSPEAGNLYEILIDASMSNQKTGVNISVISSLDTVHMEINDYLNVNDLTTGNILITEIMYDPSALVDTEGEWFEIYNNTASSVNLKNLVLQSDDGSHIINEKILLPSGESFVLVKTDNAFDGISYVYSNLTLSNTNDYISLYTYGTDGTDGILLATVNYDEGNGFPSGAGKSICLSAGLYNFTDAQSGTSWCLSTETYNTGDYGSPGQINLFCY